MTPNQPAPKPGSVVTYVLIQTIGWDMATQKDGPTDSIAVSVMVRNGPAEGRYLMKECKTAEELWNYLKALDRERDLTLAWNFNYTGPPKPKTAQEMLNELGI